MTFHTINLRNCVACGRRYPAIRTVKPSELEKFTREKCRDCRDAAEPLNAAGCGSFVKSRLHQLAVRLSVSAG